MSHPFGTIIEMDVLSMGKYRKPVAMVIGWAPQRTYTISMPSDPMLQAVVLDDHEGNWSVGQIITIPRSADRDIKIIGHL